MTVSSTQTRVSYSGNGTTTAFAVPFYFLANGDLLVILRSSAGAETTQTLNVDYTVSGAGVSTGGTVTMTAAPASGTTLVITRNVSATQTTDLLPNDRLPAESIERALDKLTMLIQQDDEVSDRSIKFPPSDSASLISQLPSSSARAGKYLGFDSLGNVSVSTSAPTPYNSADVSYVAAGSGAVIRNVRDRLRDSVSVKDFGAVGDGVADDSDAVQAAINSGKSVFVPAGTYMLNTRITIDVPVTIFGEGMGVSIFKSTATRSTSYPNYYMFHIRKVGGVSGIEMLNLTIDGNIAANTGKNYMLVIIGRGTSNEPAGSAASNVLFRDVEIKDSPYHGMYVSSGASDITVDRCWFNNNGSSGGGNNNGGAIYMDGDADNFNMVNTLSEDSWQHGVYVDSSGRASIVNCVFRDNGRDLLGAGVSFRCNYGNIIGCLMTGNNGDGLNISTSGATSTVQRTYVVATNNIIYGNNNASREVSLANIVNLIFSNNIIGKTDGTNVGSIGIRCTGAEKNWDISNNVLIGYVQAIFLDRSFASVSPIYDLNNVKIQNNIIYGIDSATDLYGITIDNTTGEGLCISGNYIYNTLHGIRFSSAASNLSKVVVRDNHIYPASSRIVFTAPTGTDIYIEAYDRVVEASVTGSTVNAGATATVTVTVTGYLNPTFVSASPPAPLADGLVWNVSCPSSSANTATVKVTNITGSPIAFSTETWKFDVKQVTIQ